MASENEAKKLNELRVVDLKAELEKRNIDTAGVKAILVKKLHKALSDEGQDPDSYTFVVQDIKSTPTKKFKKETEEESIENSENEKEDKSISEDGDKNEGSLKHIKDEVGEDAEDEETSEECKKEKVEDKEEEKKVEDKKEDENKEEDKKEKNEEPIKKEIESKKGEATEKKDEKAKTEVKTSKDKSVSEEEATKSEPIKVEEKLVPDANGLDAEDSINLTIGEDEKLMADEEETSLEKEEKDLKERDGSRGANKKSPDTGSRKGEKRNSSPDKAVDDKGKKHSDYRNLWVSGLSSVTRATDLKHVFSKLGKVVAAKVVTNAKTPGARCYGFVTLATSEDAAKCIKGLNLTELHGRLISVEAAKQDSSGHLKKPDSSQVANKPSSGKKSDAKRKADSSPRATDEKKKKREVENIVPPGTEDLLEEASSEDAKKKEEVAVERGRERERHVLDKGGRARTRSGDTSNRGSSKGRERSRSKKSPGVLSFAQIKEERDRQRLREKERALREEERRRREERERQREVERRQREEAVRLEREREKIRIERERLERERAELLKMERDRLEREKEDLKRQQMKLEEARRSKRTLSGSRDSYEERSKRTTSDVARRYEAVSAHHSTPHFESHTRSSSDYKKEGCSRRDGGLDEAPTRTRYESLSRVHREEGSRSKEGHYQERNRTATGNSSAGFRGREDRERRTEEPTHRPKSDAGSRISHHRDRFESSSKDRYPGSSESWGNSGSLGKSFGSSLSSRGEGWAMGGPDRKGPELSPWARPPAQPDRWVTGNSLGVSSRGGPSIYPQVGGIGGPSMNLQMSNSPYQNSDRFDAYKPMGSMPRKY